jgi:FkbM family methyltransferase
MNFRIYYGIWTNHIDITDLCLKKCTTNFIVFIPATESKRSSLFTDPIPYTLKSIFIHDITDKVKYTLTEYDYSKDVYIDIVNHIVYTSDNVPHDISKINLKKRLDFIHSQLKIDFGSFQEEYPEQEMVAKYITGNENVLEIGSNIGRNSLIIAYILNSNNNSNFVTMESDKDISNQLIHNRNINKLSFYIENSALSNRKLIQQGWDTIVSDEVLEGYKSVSTITWSELKNKYQSIQFDTLVLDCEGAFYYILQDTPEILDNIKLIIMENDYKDINHKQYIDVVLKNAGFTVDYSESGGWDPCYANFYEVWIKNSL